MARPEFEVPEFVSESDSDQIQERMMGNLPADISDMEGDFPYDFTMPTAIEISQLVQFNLVRCLMVDPYVGFFHTDRPGRMSLALDLMEEFRSVMVDRFVLTLINKRIMKEKYFIKKENEAVIMTDEGRKAFLSAWQSKKQETIKHPFLDEKIEWGMAPYVQSMLLARYLRGDLDEYPPFFWK